MNPQRNCWLKLSFQRVDLKNGNGVCEIMVNEDRENVVFWYLGLFVCALTI